MKPTSLQQEVLLNTDTQFAHRQLTDIDLKDSDGLTALEQLEKACWDGLVKELIPELDITLPYHKKLWLWQIHETKSFLALDFYETPGTKEWETSIDPYLFLTEIRTN
jgi:hypothetical protein